jgi:hypothetical protein
MTALRSAPSLPSTQGPGEYTPNAVSVESIFGRSRKGGVVGSEHRMRETVVASAGHGDAWVGQALCTSSNVVRPGPGEYAPPPPEKLSDFPRRPSTRMGATTRDQLFMVCHCGCTRRDRYAWAGVCQSMGQSLL